MKFTDDKSGKAGTQMHEQEIRIEKLSHLFSALASDERVEWKLLRKNEFRKYESEKYALFFVTAVSGTTISLEADDGTLISPVLVGDEIAQVIEVNDGIVVTVKFRDGIWRVTSFEWMAAYETANFDEVADEIEGMH